MDIPTLPKILGAFFFCAFFGGVIFLIRFEMKIIQRLKVIYPHQWQSFVCWQKSRLRYGYFEKKIRQNEIVDETIISYLKNMKRFGYSLIFSFSGLLILVAIYLTWGNQLITTRLSGTGLMLRLFWSSIAKPSEVLVAIFTTILPPGPSAQR